MKVEKRKGGYHLYSDVLGQLSSTSFIANNYTYYKPKTCFLFTNKSKWVKKMQTNPINLYLVLQMAEKLQRGTLFQT